MQTTYKSAADVVLNLTGETLDAPLTFHGGRNITVQGGTYPGIFAYDVEGLKVEGVVIRPPEGKVGIMVRGGSADIVKADIVGGLNGVVFLNAVGGSLKSSRISRYAGDGVHVFGSQHIDIIRNTIRDGSSDGMHHPDAIQFHNLDGAPVSDIRVLKNTVRHMGQGINNMDDGEAAWMDRMVIEGNKITVGAYWAINAHHFRDSRVVGNVVRWTKGGVTGTRKVAVKSTKVQVGPGVVFDGNDLGPGVEVLRSAA